MQNAAYIAASWSDENKQRMNASKSQYMTLSLQLNNSISNLVTINGDPVNQTSTAKLLCLRLGSHLTFSEHVNSLSNTQNSVSGAWTPYSETTWSKRKFANQILSSTNTEHSKLCHTRMAYIYISAI